MSKLLKGTAFMLAMPISSAKFFSLNRPVSSFDFLYICEH